MVSSQPSLEADEAVPRSQGRPAVQLPEPSRLWIRHSPRHWPLPSRPWVDAAAGALGRTAADPGETERLLEAFAPDLAYDDTVYLPPVPVARAAERAGLADDLARAGTPVLFQVASMEEPRPSEPGVTRVVDLLPVFLGDEPWPEPEAGWGAIWPLLPGISDGAEHWRSNLPRLAGFAWVQGIEVRLSGGDRRLLLERVGEGIFDELYHRGEAPAGERERAFAAAVATAAITGLAPFAPRPLPPAPTARTTAGNRRLAAALLLAGELSLRLGRSPAQEQAYFRAARFVDTTSYDVAALAVEGNLGVIPALDEASRRLLLDMVEKGGSLDLAELEREYLA